MEKMDKGTLHSIIQCYVIDSLIEEIFLHFSQYIEASSVTWIIFLQPS